MCVIRFHYFTVICRRPPDTEDNLQKDAHKLNQITREYGLTIFVQKTKSMAFKGRDPVRTKIGIDNKLIEQVNLFNCLGKENWTWITN